MNDLSQIEQGAKTTYRPFDLSGFDLSHICSEAELQAIASRLQRSNWECLQVTAPRLLEPLLAVATLSGVSIEVAKLSIAALLWRTSKSKTPCWSWSEAQWLELLNSSSGSRVYLAAVAYHLSGFRSFKKVKKFRQPALYASAIFGYSIFMAEQSRLTQVLHSQGYAQQNLDQFLSNSLGTLMLENGDPRLDSFTEDLLRCGQAHRRENVARAIGKISRGLAAMGIIDHPLHMRGYVGWREKSIEGVSFQWVEWCRRWRDTSTLRPRTRESNYSLILRAGLWLSQTAPHITSPSDWEMSTCADFIAAVDRMVIGEWSLESAPAKRLPGQGLPIAANSKKCFLHAMRRFFIDVELWGWCRLRFSPRYHLATPRTTAFSSGVNPRVIDDSIWLKLIWASLHLEQEDLLSEIHYPLSMIKAMAVIWTHAGLRSNEIIRLARGCAHAQDNDIAHDDGSLIKAGTLCYLDIPASKTFKEFVKPVAVVVKACVDAWLLERPEYQAPLLDERTGERVEYLFQYRGKRMGTSILNKTIIPILCAKAGVGLQDSRGQITSHRGRASAVTALANVPQGMSLIELMQWSGHSSPTSTMHYIRICPTKLAASFVKADQMSHMVSLLIDHDVIARHSDEPYAFYDLGDSYCANPFWSRCPHRMACAGCDFNLPKASARAQALESKVSIGRYLEAVPLTIDERAIVEGDLEKLDSLIRKLDNVPTLDGRTPNEIEMKKG
ncbi:Mobile element protein [Pseudomonas chlororaphis]|uniref:Mobile element protein n=1 Tax=Pseudomonas chlororaphis TaxID=587753 RepID=A0A3G7TP80_9PSED|nr:tyrosine-type recombinase/integrase [Pseudomonas chlororaphis]AZE48318.1 Mobile element protein [Pseudomonas chlororaphis]